MLLEVGTRLTDTGGLECVAHAGRTAWQLVLTAEELIPRARWSQAILETRRDFDLVSFWRSGQPLDIKLAALDTAYHDLHAWDLRTLVGPLFTQIERQFPDESWLVVGEGRPALPLFNVRAALRVGVLRGLVPPDELTNLCAVHAWAGKGCAALGKFDSPDALPRFDGTAIRLLIGQPPAELDAYFQIVARGQPLAPELLIHDTVDTDEPQLAAMVARADWQASLQDALLNAASTLGVRVMAPASRRDLAEVLAAGDPRALVVLVAHQDRDGIHLADGPVGIPELAGYLHDLRARGVPPCASIDLGVCHAEDEGNLADCLQAFGVPVVHTHGYYAHFARVLASWLWALRTLEQGGPCSLPALLDRGWIHWWADQRAKITSTTY